MYLNGEVDTFGIPGDVPNELRYLYIFA